MLTIIVGIKNLHRMNYYIVIDGTPYYVLTQKRKRFIKSLNTSDCTPSYFRKNSIISKQHVLSHHVRVQPNVKYC